MPLVKAKIKSPVAAMLGKKVEQPARKQIENWASLTEIEVRVNEKSYPKTGYLISAVTEGYALSFVPGTVREQPMFCRVKKISLDPVEEEEECDDEEEETDEEAEAPAVPVVFKKFYWKIFSSYPCASSTVASTLLSSFALAQTPIPDDEAELLARALRSMGYKVSK